MRSLVVSGIALGVAGVLAYDYAPGVAIWLMILGGLTIDRASQL